MAAILVLILSILAADVAGQDLITLQLTISQDPEITARLYDPAHGDMGITPALLQSGLFSTYFQEGAVMFNWLRPGNSVDSINCSVGSAAKEEWMGGICTFTVLSPWQQDDLVKLFAESTRQLYTNAAILCRSNITWKGYAPPYFAIEYSCNPPDNSTLFIKYQAPWLCCLFAPNAPFAPNPPTDFPNGQDTHYPGISPPPPYSPETPYFPAWPDEPPPSTNQPPSPPPHPPSRPFTPQWPQWPPGQPGNEPLFPMTDGDVFPPAPPPGKGRPPPVPPAITGPMAHPASCDTSSLGYYCVKNLGPVALHWSWGFTAPTNLCTGGYKQSANASDGVMVHYAVEAHAQPSDHGSPPGYVGMAFAQTAGAMVPALAVLGMGDPTTGVVDVLYQKLTDHESGVASTDLQSVIRQAATVQQAGMTLLCFSLPLPMGEQQTSAAGAGRRQLLVSTEPQAWLPPDIYTDVQYNWAVGPASSAANTAWLLSQRLPRHTQAGGAVFNLLSGQAKVKLYNNQLPLLVVHACFLAVAFLILVPSAALVSRHRHVFFTIPNQPRQHEPEEDCSSGNAQTCEKNEDEHTASQGQRQPEPSETAAEQDNGRASEGGSSRPGTAGPVAEATGDDDSIAQSASLSADRASQRTSRTTPVLTAQIDAQDSKVKHGAVGQQEGAGASLQATLHAPLQQSSHRIIKTTMRAGIPNIPGRGLGPAPTRYDCTMMAPWLRMHVVLTIFGFLCYMAAFAFSVRWLRKSPDVSCGRGLLAAWFVLGVLVLVQLLLQAITPLFGLHLPRSSQPPRPNAHQVLGRLTIATAWAYGAITCYLIVSAPGQRRTMAVASVAAPFAGFAVLIVLVDLYLRGRHGSPRQAIWDWAQGWAFPSLPQPEPQFDDVFKIPEDPDEVRPLSSSQDLIPTTFVEQAAMPGLMPSGADSDSGAAATAHSAGGSERWAADSPWDGAQGQGEWRESALRKPLSMRRSVSPAATGFDSTGRMISSRPSSAADRVSVGSARTSPHLQAGVIQDAEDTRPRQSPQYRVAVVVPVDDTPVGERPSPTRSSARLAPSLSAIARTDALLSAVPAVKQTLPPLSQADSGTKRKPLALAPLSAGGTGDNTAVRGIGAGNTQTAGFARSQSHVIAASRAAATSPRDPLSPSRQLQKPLSLNVLPDSTAATMAAEALKDEEARPTRDRSSIPRAWSLDTDSSEWQIAAGRASVSTITQDRPSQPRATNDSLLLQSQASDRPSAVSSRMSGPSDAGRGSAGLSQSVSLGPRPYKLPPVTDWGITYEVEEGSD